MEGHAYALGDFHRTAVTDRTTQLQGLLGVLLGIERGGRRAAETGAPFALPLGILLLDMRRVHEHQFEEIAGGLRGVDRSLVALFDQTRQQSAVVEMGMGDDHCVEAGRIEGESAAVLFLSVANALAHAAFEQNLDAIKSLQQIAGAGYFLDGADEGE
ncbi:hypothetical protein D9M73_157080 [compost metagenome]